MDSDEKREQSDSHEKMANNPYIANAPASTGEVRLRIPVRETCVPKPWKKIEHVIIVSYICYLAMVFPGAIANWHAWEALKFRDLGAYSEAKSLGRSAVCWVYVGLTILAIGVVAAIILVIVHFTSGL